MERVFSVEATASFSSSSLRGEGGRSFQEGRVEKALAPGRFLAVLGNGRALEVSGPPDLRPGSRVRVFFNPEGAREAPSAGRVAGPEGGTVTPWSALIPLAFGGGGAQARVEFHLERQRKGTANKKGLPAYLLFWVRTQEVGEMQWSVHLRGRNASLQVYVRGPKGTESLRELVRRVEGSLRSKGFLLSSPTVFLDREFRVPAGVRPSGWEG